MRLDGFGLLIENMGEMIRFYRDVLGFEIKEEEDSSNVSVIKSSGTYNFSSLTLITSFDTR